MAHVGRHGSSLVCQAVSPAPAALWRCGLRGARLRHMQVACHRVLDHPRTDVPAQFAHSS